MSSLATASVDGRHTLHCDLTKVPDVEELIRRLTGFGPINHFFWVAGTWWEGEFAEMSPEEVLRIIDVNFRNAMLVAHWVWQRFAISSAAPLTYTVIGSTSGVRPRKHQEIYAATKHAQVGFARSLGESSRDSKNVRVSLFILGGMRTHLFDRKPPENYAEFMNPTKVAAHIISRVSEQRDPYLEQEISRDTPLGQALR